MDIITSLPSFVIAVVLISASPGPALALIFRRAALRGYRAAIPTVLGLELGLYIWALTAAAGFAALVAASQVAFVVLKIVGAAVLIALGIRSWRTAWLEGRESAAVAHSPGHAELMRTTPDRGRRSFGEGLVVQLANPKAAIFMVAFYPQFVSPDRNLFATTAVLALLQVLIETGLYLAVAAGVGRGSTWFSQSRIRRRIEAISGSVLIALGLRVATTRP